MTYTLRLFVGLVVALTLSLGVFLAGVLAVSAAPPGACSPWPSCKDDSTSDDDDGPGGSDTPAASPSLP